nr:aminopeptidase P family protein [Sharpea azabuensis]
MNMKELQKLLKENNIDYYIVPTDDDHQSEYVGNYYRVREFLSGFTGSAGTLVIGQDDAYLWTDGRYFIQAAKQLKDGIQLMKMAEPGVPTIEEFLVEHLNENSVLAFDPKVMTARFVIDLENAMDDSLELDPIDFTDQVWHDRPEKSHEKAFIYDTKYHGVDASIKLEDIRSYMDMNGCDAHLVSSLDDIAWIFNIRGNDIEYSPTVLAFALIEKDKAALYLQNGVYDDEMKDYYASIGVTIKDYDAIYEDVSKLEGTLLVDLNAINYALYESINCEIADGINPSQYFKSTKNEVEIANTKNAHLKDGVAVTRFMYWLKHNVGHVPMSEISVADKLEDYRREQDLFLEPSFATICAYGSNGAIIHYQATKESNATISNKGMLMIDSGGQYLDGTTDITRTFVLGDLSNEERHDFTLVAKSWLHLMYARFPHGMTGINLDTYARAPMWAEGKDFKHGTGHGVGHLLNVHEGPQGIRPKQRTGENAVFEAGMITSDEPGYYREGHYGIRHENELLCVEDGETEYGTFLRFEPLTYVPLDLDGIDTNMLTDEEKAMLNDYHQFVYEKIAPLLNDEEREWLSIYTREI